MKKIFVILMLTFCSNLLFSAGKGIEGDSTEIMIIDNFITPELPHKLVLSFFTDTACKSKVVLSGGKSYDVSAEPSEDHKVEIDLTDYKYDSAVVRFQIVLENAEGILENNEIFEAEMPVEQEVKNESGPGFLFMCCLGSTIFGLPSPSYVRMNGKDYFSLAKDIPVLSIYSSTYNYPVGYFSIGYSHIFKSELKNIMRLGYKQIIELPYIEYVSPGINGYTNFRGINGLSPEISLGIFKVYNVFTLYTKYRYNIRPNNSSMNFHEVSVGLYSSFFTFHL